MPLPLITGIGSAIAGLFSGLGRGKASKRMLREQQELANQQRTYADRIRSAVDELMRQSPSVTDAYGTGAVYDPATGQWRVQLSERDRALQDASDAEELARLTGDQALARQGMYGAENIRQGAEAGSRAFLQDLLNMREGRGKVDPSQVLADLIRRRTEAVNAGYNDVMTGLRSQSMRTGADDTWQLRRLAEQRSRDIARTMGVPEVEALQISDELNQRRNESLLGNYGLMAGIGSNIVDRGFNPANRNNLGLDTLFQAKQFDLARTGLGLEGNAASAGILGNISRSMLGARRSQQEMAPINPVGNFIGALGNVLSSNRGFFRR